MAWNSRRLVAFVFLMGVVVGVARAQQAPPQPPDFSSVEEKTVPVSDNLYVLMGVGRNMGHIGALVGNDGILLVDSQFGPMHKKIEEALAKVSNQRVRYLVNTHVHPDHTDGNAGFGKDGAIIIAHENLRKRMANPQPNAQGVTPPAPPKEALPVITYSDSLTLHLNGEEVTVFYPGPAHTDGDSVVYFRRANVMHLGDIPASVGYPNINNTTGFSTDGCIAALDRIMKMGNADTKIISGHRGPIVTMKDLQQWKDMLTTVRDRILSGIRAGKTLEQVIASKPTAEFDEAMKGAQTPEYFVTGIYQDLAKRKS